MADKMDKFFGLNTPSGKAALVKEREKLDVEIMLVYARMTLANMRMGLEEEEDKR